MECWEETKPLVETLVTEMFPIGPVTSMALNDESQYDLNVHLVTGEYQERFKEVLLDQYLDSGEYSMREFTKQLSKEYKRFKKVTKADDVLPSEAIMRFRFDRTSPTAEAYAVKSSATMVTDLADTNIAGVRSLVGRAFQEQRTYQQTATALTALLSEAVPLNSVSQRLGSVYGINANGLFPRYANAVANFAEQTALDLTERGITGSKALKIVQQRSDKYANKLRRSRAKMIARTEIMRANNAGRLHASDQASAKGLFDRDKAKRQWITAPQDACYICGPLNGVAIPYNESWYEGEPAFVHPNCRCTWLLIPNVPVYGVPTVSGDGTASNPFVWNFANQQNQSLAGIQTGGATVSGAPDSIPEPKPMQSTAVTDEVVPSSQIPSPDDVNDSNIEDFINNFEWDNQSFTGTRGRTWAELTEPEQDYLTNMMIDTEIREAIPNINDISFFGGDQGYKLMTGAPEEIAQEILKLQEETQALLLEMDVKRRVRTMQIKLKQDTVEAGLEKPTPPPQLRMKGRVIVDVDEALVADPRTTTAPQTYVVRGREITAREMVQAVDEGLGDTVFVGGKNYDDLINGMRVTDREVNERIARIAVEMNADYKELSLRALEKTKELGLALERETTRRVDEAIASVGGKTPEELKAVTDELVETLTEVGAKYGNDVDELSVIGTGNQQVRLDLNTGKNVASDNARNLDDFFQTLDVDKQLPDEYFIQTFGMTAEDLSVRSPEEKTVRWLLDTIGGRKATSGRYNPTTPFDRGLIKFVNGQVDINAVPMEDFLHTMDGLSRLISIDNKFNILGEYSREVLNDAMNNLKAVIQDDIARGQTRLATRLRIGNEIDKVIEQVDGFVENMRESYLLMDEINGFTAQSLSVGVSDKQIRLVDELLDDWIAVEARTPSRSMPEDLIQGYDTVTDFLNVKKRDLQNLKERIARETGVTDLTSATITRLNAGYRQEFFDLLEEYNRVYLHAINEQKFLTNASRAFTEMDTSLEQGAKLLGRRWTTRGEGPLSYRRFQQTLEDIKADFGKQAGAKAKAILGDDAPRNWGDAIKQVLNSQIADETLTLTDEFEQLVSSNYFRSYLTEALDVDEVFLYTYGDDIKRGANGPFDHLSDVGLKVTEGDVKFPKVIGQQHGLSDIIEAQVQFNEDLLNVVNKSMPENFMDPIVDIDRALIRREVLADARMTGGDLDFQFGTKVDNDILSGGLGKEAGSEMGLTSAEYQAKVTEMKENTLSFAPSKWIERIQRQTTLDQTDAFGNTEIGVQFGNRASKSGKTKMSPTRAGKVQRDGLWFVTDVTDPTRAHANQFYRIGELNSPKVSWLTTMEDVPDSIFMVYDEMVSRGGHINVTFNNLNQSTLTHEMYHMFQKQSGVFGDLEQAWIWQRTSIDADPERMRLPSYQQVKMSEITGNKTYHDYEVTVPDLLGDAYSGKLYDRYGNLNSASQANIGPVNPYLQSVSQGNFDFHPFGTKTPSEGLTMGVEGMFSSSSLNEGKLLNGDAYKDTDGNLYIGEYFREDGTLIPYWDRQINQFRSADFTADAPDIDEEFTSWLFGMVGGV